MNPAENSGLSCSLKKGKMLVIDPDDHQTGSSGLSGKHAAVQPWIQDDGKFRGFEWFRMRFRKKVSSLLMRIWYFPINSVYKQGHLY